MTSRVRIQHIGGNAPVGVIVKNGQNTVEQAILNEKGDEYAVVVYPGIILVVGELAKVEEAKVEDNTISGPVPNPFVPDLDGKKINDPWDEENNEAAWNTEIDDDLNEAVGQYRG
jgi:hypothetical protein